MLKLCELVVRMSTSKPENMSPQLLRNSEVGHIQYLAVWRKKYFFRQEVSTLGEPTLTILPQIVFSYFWSFPQIIKSNLRFPQIVFGLRRLSANCYFVCKFSVNCFSRIKLSLLQKSHIFCKFCSKNPKKSPAALILRGKIPSVSL